LTSFIFTIRVMDEKFTPFGCKYPGAPPHLLAGVLPSMPNPRCFFDNCNNSKTDLTGIAVDQLFDRDRIRSKELIVSNI
jgi:hypothetical protein